ncbi:MAG: type II toxin-antitoxin system HicA family toxin [Deltaproteobacteria bacterium]|nr:type II toxin-antitoxin system HicA family toxin [Deltaproteobacteria bacterium]
MRRLKAAGVLVDASRGKGGHCLLRYNNKRTTLPCHGNDLGNVLIKRICRQLGLDEKEIL